MENEKATQLPIARIRTMMKTSPSIGQIAPDALFVVCRAAEMFIGYITKNAHKKGTKALDYKVLEFLVGFDPPPTGTDHRLQPQQPTLNLHVRPGPATTAQLCRRRSRPAQDRPRQPGHDLLGRGHLPVGLSEPRPHEHDRRLPGVQPDRVPAVPVRLDQTVQGVRRLRRGPKHRLL
uniref:(northern house mosquito) hypothetical protein n=1 Tax=Culex pipiens TaxID=7175 RepID=A0A8D8G487_CULPI